MDDLINLSSMSGRHNPNELDWSQPKPKESIHQAEVNK